MAGSRFLNDKKDLRTFHAKLAAKIGVKEAIVLQQIHYWLEKNRETNNNFKEGRYWTYNTYKEWKKENFQFWSTRTISRAIKSLEKQGLLITDNFNKVRFDKTKWYSIDYDKLKLIEVEVYGRSQVVNTNTTDCRDGSGQNDVTNTRDLPETSTDNNMSSQKDDEIQEVWQQYKSIFADYYTPRKFSKKRKSKIKQRLNTYSVDELVNAMKAIAANDYMIGKNDNGKFYAKPEYCFRNDEKVEEWLNDYEQSEKVNFDADIDYYADLREE